MCVVWEGLGETGQRDRELEGNLGNYLSHATSKQDY